MTIWNLILGVSFLLPLGLLCYRNSITNDNSIAWVDMQCYLGSDKNVLGGFIDLL